MRLLNISLQGSTLPLDGPDVVAGPDACKVAELAPLQTVTSCNVSFTLTAADFAASPAQLQVVANASTVFPAITTQNSTIAPYDLQYARTLSVTLSPTLQPDSKSTAWLCLSCWVLPYQAALSCLKPLWQTLPGSSSVRA